MCTTGFSSYARSVSYWFWASSNYIMENSNWRVHISIKCWLFHLTQNTWRHVQALLLHDWWSCIFAGSRCCSRHGVLHPDAIGLLIYFDHTYVSGTLIDNRVVPSVFPPELWNVYNETINNIPRTNHFSEAWNLKFQMLVARMHLTIWKSINAIQLEQETTKTKILQSNIGSVKLAGATAENPPPPPRA